MFSRSARACAPALSRPHQTLGVPAPRLPATPTSATALAASAASAGSAASADGVPVTIHPGQDVRLRAGVPLGALRDALATVTGRAELRDARIHAGDHPLDDDHVVGQAPLVAGALLRVTRGAPDPASHALGALLHVAHLTGPDAGFVEPVVATTATRAGGPDMRGVDVRGVDVRARARRHGEVQVRFRPRRSCRVTVVDREGRSRRVGWVRLRRWVSWKPGTTLEVVAADGRVTSRTELRRRPRLVDVTFSALTRSLVDEAAGRGPSPAAATRSLALTLSTALLPALASVALAVALRNPLFALLAVVGPLLLLGQGISARRRERATGPHVPASELLGPPCSRAGLRPVDLLTAALASDAVPRRDLAARDGTPGRLLRPSGRPGSAEELPVLPGDLRGGCLAVVGARADVLAHGARTVVALHAVGRAVHVVVLAPPERTPDWSWARWLPGTRATTPASDAPLPSGPGTLLVVDADRSPDLNARLGAWHAAHGERAALLVLADRAAAVPSWCTGVATVSPDGVLWTAPGHADDRTAFEGIGPRWLDAYSRRVAALSGTGRWAHVEALVAGRADPHHGADPGLPRSVALVNALELVLEHVVEPATPVAPALHAFLPADAGVALGAAVSRRWARRGRSELRAPIGIGADGRPLTVDLLADGPHALVAGTTGAGKSELLQTLVLTLALRTSPDDLAIALVDYKGGAGFGPCVDLPHVVGQVTDLDPGIAERALDGLRAELRRRERLFAQVGAANLDGYRALPTAPERLPRLLVVVDEFRAMADDHPQFIPGLVRIAAQGRSLGIHLVLATQRPGGAITPDMRANISLRIALRVVDDAESGDVIDSPGAASIPAGLPGRALVRRGLAAPEMVQTFHAAGRAADALLGAWCAPRWDATGPEPEWSFPPPAGDPAGRGVDPARMLVDATLAAARSLSVERPRVPWTPDLPARTSWLDLPASTGSRLVLGVADRPEAQRHEPFGWDVATGHLLVVGRAGTGRTTALRTVVHAARAAGHLVHVVGPAALVPSARATVATVVDSSDPRRLARLLTLLLGGTREAVGPGRPAPREHVVVIDGLEDVQRSLATVHRGAGADLMTALLRDGVGRGIHVAVSATAVPSTSTSALLSQRILFSGRQKHDDTYLGIPTDLAGRGGVPGRAVFVDAGLTVRCQVAVAGSGTDGDPPRTTQPAARTAGPTRAELRRWTIEPVPRAVRISGTVTTGTVEGTLHLGLGGDHATPTGLAPARGLLVCGPHGSGRSSALALMARAVSEVGDVVAVVTRDRSLQRAAAALGCSAVLTTATPHAIAAFVHQVATLEQSLGTDDTATRASRRRVVIIDDVDVVAQTCPSVLDAVQRLRDLSSDTVVLASATTTAAAGAFRGLLAELRALGRGVVLDPAAPGSSEVFGLDLGWLVEPELHLPGRGALVDGRRSWLVQVAHQRDGSVDAPAP